MTPGEVSEARSRLWPSQCVAFVTYVPDVGSDLSPLGVLDVPVAGVGKDGTFRQLPC